MIHLSHSEPAVAEAAAQDPDRSQNTMPGTPRTASRLSAYGPRTVCLTCRRTPRFEESGPADSWLSDVCDPAQQ